MKIQKLGLFVNPSKLDTLSLIHSIIDACTRAGIALYTAEPIIGLTLALPLIPSYAEIDAALILGGDGTILHAVASMGKELRPVLGLHLGTLGFLSEIERSDLTETVTRLAKGAYKLEKRMLLSATIEEESKSYTALNDIVITRGSYARILDVDVYIDGVFASRFAGDGAIAASPTGSTAYSLSAGGPIVVPGLDCIVLAPICPHTLSSRTILVSSDAIVRMVFQSRDHDGGMMLSIDGAQGPILRNKTELIIQKSDQQLPFIRFGEEHHFFERLRCKLSEWGG